MPIVACCIFRVFFRVWQEPSPLYILICSKLEDRVTTSLQINISSFKSSGTTNYQWNSCKKEWTIQKVLEKVPCRDIFAILYSSYIVSIFLFIVVHEISTLSKWRCWVDGNPGEGAVGLQDPQEGAKLRRKLEPVDSQGFFLPIFMDIFFLFPFHKNCVEIWCITQVLLSWCNLRVDKWNGTPILITLGLSPC